MSIYIRVSLPKDRNSLGEIAFYDPITGLRSHGPWKCLGKSSKSIDGIPHNNPSLVTTKKYGNTPLGTFKVVGVKGPDDIVKYGLYPRLQLVGTSEDAKEREKVANNTIRIHGGRIRTDGKLSVTLGCIRVDEPTMLIINETIKELNLIFPFELVVKEDGGLPLVEGCDPSQDADPSPN